jgi:hypothetical protein
MIPAPVSLPAHPRETTGPDASAHLEARSAHGHKKTPRERGAKETSGRSRRLLAQADQRERERERDVSAALTHLPTGPCEHAKIPTTSVPNGLTRKQPLIIRFRPSPQNPLLSALHRFPRNRPKPDLYKSSGVPKGGLDENNIHTWEVEVKPPAKVKPPAWSPPASKPGPREAPPPRRAREGPPEGGRPPKENARSERHQGAAPDQALWQIS